MRYFCICLLFLSFCACKGSTDSVNYKTPPLVKQYRIQEDSLHPISRVSGVCSSPSESFFLVYDKDRHSLYLYDSVWKLVKNLQPDISFSDSVVKIGIDPWFGHRLYKFSELSGTQQQKLERQNKSRFSNGVFISDSEIYIVGRINTFIKKNEKDTSVDSAKATYIPCFFKYNIPRQQYTIYPVSRFHNGSYIDERFIAYLPKTKEIIASTHNNSAMETKQYDNALAIASFTLDGKFTAPICKLPKEAKFAGLDYGQFHPSAVIDDDGNPHISFTITPEIYAPDGTVAYTLDSLPVTNDHYFKAMADYRSRYPNTDVDFFPWDSLMKFQKAYITGMAATERNTQIFADLWFEDVNIDSSTTRNYIHEYKDGKLLRRYEVPPQTSDGGATWVFYHKRDHALLEFRLSEAKGWIVNYLDWQ